MMPTKKKSTEAVGAVDPLCFSLLLAMRTCPRGLLSTQDAERKFVLLNRARFCPMKDLSQKRCHPGRASFCAPKDLGEPREASRCLRRNNARLARILIRCYFTMILFVAGSRVPCTRTRLPSNFFTSSW